MHYYELKTCLQYLYHHPTLAFIFCIIFLMLEYKNFHLSQTYSSAHQKPRPGELVTPAKIVHYVIVCNFELPMCSIHDRRIIFV
jgi:hypothetical protein